MSSLPVVLGLDISSANMGLALGRPGEAPRCWSVKLKLEGFDDEDAGAKLVRVIADLVKVHRPDRVFAEAPIEHMSEGSSAHTILLQYGLYAVATAAFRVSGIRTDKANVQSVRKAFIGEARPLKGTAKRRVREMCKLLGWAITNDDQADAAAVWYFGCQKVALNATPFITPKMLRQCKLAVEGEPALLRRSA